MVLIMVSLLVHIPFRVLQRILRLLSACIRELERVFDFSTMIIHISSPVVMMYYTVR
jgi:hypothetical protein